MGSGGRQSDSAGISDHPRSARRAGAEKLSIRFTFSTNGQKIYAIDMESAQECDADCFPTPEQLWNRTFVAQNDWRDLFATVPCEDKGGTWPSRYHQEIAIEWVLEAIAADKVLIGEVEKGKRYTESDFNRNIVIDEREKKRVQIFMGQINQKEKTLVFCATQEHALAVRDYINQIKTSKEPNYCARVTADDGALYEMIDLLASL